MIGELTICPDGSVGRIMSGLEATNRIALKLFNKHYIELSDEEIKEFDVFVEENAGKTIKGI